MSDTKHIPVMLDELMSYLDIAAGMRVLDVTLGGGGHALAAIEMLKGSGEFVGIDLDKKALTRFEEKHKDELVNINLINTNFRNIANVIGGDLDVVYADLGFSTDQLNEFISFQRQGLLDLRLDKSLGVKASDLVNALYEKELIGLFEKYGDEPLAKRIAREIIKYRNDKPIVQKSDLVNVINIVISKLNGSVAPMLAKKTCARVFQALRIAVNDEYNALDEFVKSAFEKLKPGGKIGIISFHSGEDRIVKQNFKNFVKSKNAKWICELQTPSKFELKSNPKARSAKLRVLQKI